MRLFIAALERGTRDAVARPRGRDRGGPRRRRRPRPEADPAEVDAHPAAAAARAPSAAVRLHGRRASGSAFAGFFADRGLIGDPPERRPSCSPTSCCPGRGRRSSRASGRQPQRRAPGPTAPCQRTRAKTAGEAAEGRVGREVLLDLRDRRPAAEAGEAADQLHVGEVAGGQRVGLAAAAEPEHLERPGPISGIRSRRRSPLGVGGVDPPGGDLARAA